MNIASILMLPYFSVNNWKIYLIKFVHLSSTIAVSDGHAISVTAVNDYYLTVKHLQVKLYVDVYIIVLKTFGNTTTQLTWL
jgi:hypothetical protein